MAVGMVVAVREVEAMGAAVLEAAERGAAAKVVVAWEAEGLAEAELGAVVTEGAASAVVAKEVAGVEALVKAAAAREVERLEVVHVVAARTVVRTAMAALVLVVVVQVAVEMASEAPKEGLLVEAGWEAVASVEAGKEVEVRAVVGTGEVDRAGEANVEVGGAAGAAAAEARWAMVAVEVDSSARQASSEAAAREAAKAVVVQGKERRASAEEEAGVVAAGRVLAWVAARESLHHR